MRTTFTRALVAAAAILALTVSSAAARPIDPTIGAPERQQDLRHLAAGNSVPSAEQHRGSVYAAPEPVAVSQPAAHTSGSSDDSDPWMVIALGVAGFCVVAACAIVATGGMRAHPRAT